MSESLISEIIAILKNAHNDDESITAKILVLLSLGFDEEDIKKAIIQFTKDLIEDGENHGDCKSWSIGIKKFIDHDCDYAIQYSNYKNIDA